MRIYGLFAFVHVASDGIMPVTLVEAWAVSKRTTLTKTNPSMIVTVKKALESSFFTVQPQTIVGWGFNKRVFVKVS
jgi:hypothetical protein